MISTMWTLAPAGARGPVGLAARAAACTAASPVAARLRALPVTAAVRAVTPAIPVLGTPLPGTGVFGTRVFGTPAIDALGTTGYAQQISKRIDEQHNGTTLGIYSSRRPSS